jgi:hypothetical protein
VELLQIKQAIKDFVPRDIEVTFVENVTAAMRDLEVFFDKKMMAKIT